MSELHGNLQPEQWTRTEATGYLFQAENLINGLALPIASVSRFLKNYFFPLDV